MSRRPLVAVLALGICRALVVNAQASGHAHTPAVPQDSAVSAFVAAARAGTEKYKDRGRAIEDGYRRLGPDFPTMGEHWANPEFVIRGQFDPARPGLLTYVTIAGEAKLMGVVYALPLGPGDLPPAFPAGRDAWHDHLGSIEEESMMLSHASPSHAMETRLSVLHAWIWEENPGGMFVTDNWALPLLRLGVTAPAGLSRDASRGLALIGGSADYYKSLIESAGLPEASEMETIERILQRHVALLEDWWRAREPASALSHADLQVAAQHWGAVRTDLLAALTRPVVARLRKSGVLD